MKTLGIPPDLEEKIYDIKYKNETISKITTYFPLEENEKDVILKMSGTNKGQITFKSIFSDKINPKEWIETKEQIKKKFQDELFDID